LYNKEIEIWKACCSIAQIQGFAQLGIIADAALGLLNIQPGGS
jgi:hypothetical protein